MSPEHEIADRLEQMVDGFTGPKEKLILQAAALLRRVPTREQKLEALQHMSVAVAYGCYVSDSWRIAPVQVTETAAKLSARFARKSLRLLGLEDEAS